MIERKMEKLQIASQILIALISTKGYEVEKIIDRGRLVDIAIEYTELLMSKINREQNQ